MTQFLNRYVDAVKFITVCFTTTGVVYLSLLAANTVYAANYFATVTGYAFGRTSASGVTLQQWHFANHPTRTLCGGTRDASGD